MTGLPRFGLSNGCKVVLFADIRRSPHQIPVSLEHPPSYERHGRASVVAEYYRNTLHNVYVDEKLIQLTIEA